MSFLLFLIAETQYCYALSPPSPHANKSIDTEIYKLIHLDSKYFLRIKGQKPDIRIPSEWLINKKPINTQLEKYITLNKFESQITAFRIDNFNKLVGLHLSSYDIHDFGKRSSPGAAGGKDIFLIYERKTKKIYNGNLNLGISKMRKKDNHCFYGKFTHFYFHQFPTSHGHNAIGAQTEEIKCTEYKTEGKISKGIPRYYKMGPIRWYQFKGKDKGWEYMETVIRDIKADNIITHGNVWKLPRIGLSRTPVDYVMFLRTVDYPNNE